MDSLILSLFFVSTLNCIMVNGDISFGLNSPEDYVKLGTRLGESYLKRRVDDVVDALMLDLYNNILKDTCWIPGDEAWDIARKYSSKGGFRIESITKSRRSKFSGYFDLTVSVKPGNVPKKGTETINIEPMTILVSCKNSAGSKWYNAFESLKSKLGETFSPALNRSYFRAQREGFLTAVLRGKTFKFKQVKFLHESLPSSEDEKKALGKFD